MKRKLSLALIALLGPITSALAQGDACQRQCTSTYGNACFQSCLTRHVGELGRCRVLCSFLDGTCQGACEEPDACFRKCKYDVIPCYVACDDPQNQACHDACSTSQTLCIDRCIHPR